MRNKKFYDQGTIQKGVIFLGLFYKQSLTSFLNVLLALLNSFFEVFIKFFETRALASRKQQFEGICLDLYIFYY